MKLGVDLSINDELAAFDPHYYYDGKEVDPFSFFAEHCRVSMTRLRLWVRPYDEQGNPFGGGTNDLPCFIRLAKKAQEAGMQILLDFHYSDFWVDPGRQNTPRDWADKKTLAEIAKTLGDYTRTTLRAIRDAGIDLAAIQVGNEITHGMVWPYGEIWREHDSVLGGGFEGFAVLFKAGCAACKEIYPNAKTVCHVEHSGSHDDIQGPFFEKLFAAGADFDVIGESYYPYWHGPFAALEDNITRLKAKYHKEVWIVEAGYEYMKSTVEGHHSEFADATGDEFVVGNVNGRVPFAGTKEGQAAYLKKLLSVSKSIGIDMVFYWEPAWIMRPGNGWAKDAGQVYCGCEPGNAANDWANECLFDMEGNANPAVEVFNQDFVDSL